MHGLKKGSAGNRNWTVSGSGDSVYQSINGEPTYFASPESFINKEFSGSFTHNGDPGHWDNDYVGFVFGYNGLDDYYLFDWKQGNQDVAKAGFGLYKISAGSKNFWSHTGAGITTLATNLSTNKG
ncbi:MAG: hypothetical protein GY951_16380 [Psychromonas sp.]|nr:hypothetical protein [Alteromonadales bacterium]MCP5079616.1 hypothetical protein [Psychromonas sp.]